MIGTAKRIERFYKGASTVLAHTCMEFPQDFYKLGLDSCSEYEKGMEVTARFRLSTT